jgi:hypothetical protein
VVFYSREEPMRPSEPPSLAFKPKKNKAMKSTDQNIREEQLAIYAAHFAMELAKVEADIPFIGSGTELRMFSAILSVEFLDQFVTGCNGFFVREETADNVVSHSVRFFTEISEITKDREENRDGMFILIHDCMEHKEVLEWVARMACTYANKPGAVILPSDPDRTQFLIENAKKELTDRLW